MYTQCVYTVCLQIFSLFTVWKRWVFLNSFSYWSTNRSIIDCTSICQKNVGGLSARFYLFYKILHESVCLMASTTFNVFLYCRFYIICILCSIHDVTEKSIIFSEMLILHEFSKKSSNSSVVSCCIILFFEHFFLF